MNNIIKGRLYLERGKEINFPSEITLNVLGYDFTLNNFVLIKKSYSQNIKVDLYDFDTIKSKTTEIIHNILYEFDINNNSSQENWLVKDEVKDALKQYVLENQL